MRPIRSMLAAGTAAVLIAGLLPGVAAANGPVPVATGLDNPRGIAIGSDGAIYVAESGRGGDELVSAVIEGEPAFACVGNTGGVTRIDRKGEKRVADLPSLAEAFDPDGPGGDDPSCDVPGTIGFAATGPTGIDLTGKGTLSVALGLGGDLEVQDEVGEAFGSLHQVLPNGKVKMLANITAHEEADDPDGEGPDSNPYGVAFLDDGSRLVADAGANALFQVWQDGTVETVAVFPRLAPAPFVPPSCTIPFPLPPAGTPIPAQAVTTSVAVGPDGAWYVGLLTGFPFTRNTADVYRVDPTTHAVTNYTGGIDLSYITGIDFGPDGSLYVVEFTQASLLDAEFCNDQSPGAVWKVSGGTKTKLADAPLPSDVAVARDGSVYVTVLSILPGAGEVWKLGG